MIPSTQSEVQELALSAAAPEKDEEEQGLSQEGERGLARECGLETLAESGGWGRGRVCTGVIRLEA